MSQTKTQIGDYVITLDGNLVTVVNDVTGYSSKVVTDGRDASAYREYERSCELARKLLAESQKISDAALTDQQAMAEVIEFEADFAELILNLRQRRNVATGEAKTKLRAVGDKLEDALTDIRKASAIVRGLS